MEERQSVMSQIRTVLVTGSAGRIGQAVVAELKARGWPVRGFDRVSTPGVAEQVIGSITDTETVRQAMANVRTLIHLAATPDDDDFVSQLMPNNILGVYQVLDAARVAGVQRMILASSGQVVWGQRLTGPWPVRTDTALTPRYWYAATKAFLEAAGRAFADAHGMEVIAVRLGWCPRTVEQVREITHSDWAQDVYLSPGDAGRFFACAVEAQLPQRYAIVYASSRPRNKVMFDLEPTRTLLGYEPRESWPDGIEQ